jgi:hypothetical protein
MAWTWFVNYVNSLLITVSQIGFSKVLTNDKLRIWQTIIFKSKMTKKMKWVII